MNIKRTIAAQAIIAATTLTGCGVERTPIARPVQYGPAVIGASSNTAVIVLKDSSCVFRHTLVNADNDLEGRFDYALVQGGCASGGPIEKVLVRQNYDGPCADCVPSRKIETVPETAFLDKYGTMGNIRYR